MLTAEQYREAEFGYTLEESRKGFIAHAIVFGLVMTGLIVLNVCLIVFTSANFPWAIFPLVGWGIGLTFHYVYGYRRAAEAARVRQRKVEQYAQREEELV
jgi:2TM domain-containing protein